MNQSRVLSLKMFYQRREKNNLQQYATQIAKNQIRKANAGAVRGGVSLKMFYQRREKNNLQQYATQIAKNQIRKANAGAVRGGDCRGLTKKIQGT